MSNAMTALSPISDATTFTRTDTIIDTQIDNEVVALNIESGTCYGLNAVGSRIWELLRTPIRVQEIFSILLSEYSVAPEVCKQDVLDLLNELQAEGLIKSLDQS